jgi:pimeloyl-ACP methyl ester carboxylesterase
MADGDAALDVEVRGRGPRVVFVHGSVMGRRTWQHQAPLAERHELYLADRPGFGASPPLPRGDFELEAPLFAELLGDGAHLVGHSYGAVIALYAAALRPQAVRSLTISEPGCLAVAAHDPLVAQQLAHGKLLYEHACEMTPMQFLTAFRGGAGSTHATPEQLEGELLQGVQHAMCERPPWEGEPPLARLRACAYPKLVVSGGHAHVFETVCDVVAERIGAQRVVIPGRGHSVPATGAPYNAALQAFLVQAERRAA